MIHDCNRGRFKLLTTYGMTTKPMNAIRNFLRDRTHIIWDWNGTLLDDFHLCHDILKQEMTKSGLAPLTPEVHRELFQFPVQEFYRKVGFDFEKEPFHQIADNYMEAYIARAFDCRLFDEVETFLEQTRKEGISHAVLSAAPEKYLHQHLAHLKINHHFSHIYGLSNSFAHSKVERGQQLLSAWGAKPEEVLLIGDTDHDLEVGQSLGVEVLLIAEGHQSFEKLVRSHKHVLKGRKH